MPVKSPQFEINIRKNDNALSEAYGKYYPKAVEKPSHRLHQQSSQPSEQHPAWASKPRKAADVAAFPM